MIATAVFLVLAVIAISLIPVPVAPVELYKPAPVIHKVPTLNMGTVASVTVLGGVTRTTVEVVGG